MQIWYDYISWVVFSSALYTDRSYLSNTVLSLEDHKTDISSYQYRLFRTYPYTRIMTCTKVN